MNLGKVVGTVVSTRKEPVLDGIRFLLVRLVDTEGKDTSAFVGAADAMGAGPGEMVLPAAGSSAHLAALRRTATGGFRLADAVTLERLEALGPGERAALLLPVDALVRDLPRVDLPDHDAARFRHGGAAPAPGAADGRAAVYANGGLLGLAEVAGGVARPARLVAAPPARGAVSS